MAGLLTEMAASSADEPSLSMPVSVAVPDLELVSDTVELPVLPALPSDSGFHFSGVPTDASSNNASFTSTPPTTVADAASVASETSKQDITATLPPLDESSAPPESTERFEDGPEASDHQQHTPRPSASEEADQADEAEETPTPRRTRTTRARPNAPIYNLTKLSRATSYGKQRANVDVARGGRRRTISGETLVANDNGGANPSLDSVVQRGVDALDIDWSLSGPNTPRAIRDEVKARPATDKKKEKATFGPILRKSTRSSGAAAATDLLVGKASSLGKRSRKVFENALIPRELRRLQDTAEFTGVESKPVLHTIWSNGKYIDPNDLDENGELVNNTKKGKRPASVAQPEAEAPAEALVQAQASKEATPTVATNKQRRPKKWLDKGLYAGQPAPLDCTTGMSAAEKKKLAQLPELAPSGRVNKVLPLPMFAGLRLLINGRDFKLPFDVCNPLPPGQPKPDEWRKMTKNRFIGDAGTYWRKTDHFKDYQSKCVCKPEDGCAEDCQNRIMLYECDDTNCNVGKDYCQNRAFQKLTARTKQGGRYRVGVEVVKTTDRGYGVRSNRCFEPNQIIMEYTGEIITQAECERRMNEKYKDNECYYLMAFDQNMIIDATTGSIARFVNHSCSPNCRMEKWIVGGQPRMALFAGDRPIMTGDELTYDYNFDPFSAKNVQKCLCGSVNCRGVLGPKVTTVLKSEAQPKGPKGSSIKEAVKAATKAGKRKLQSILDLSDDGTDSSNKKRKVMKATGVKRSLSAKATAAVKKAANSISVNAKAALASAAASKTPAKAVSVRKSALRRTSKTLTKNGKQLMLAASLTTGSATIVATPASGRPTRTVKKTAPSAKPSVAKAGKGAIKATAKRGASKDSLRKTIKSAKHTISKSTGKKAAGKPGKPRQIAKRSILDDIEGGQAGLADMEEGDVDGTLAFVAESIRALEPSKTQNKIRVATD